VDALRGPAALALIAMLLTACGGGGDDPAKAESSLRQYISTVTPGAAPFPVGAGPPRVRENSCKKLPKLRLPPGARIPKGTAFWSCVVTVGRHLTVGVLVAITSSGEVFALGQTPRRGTETPPRLPPATVYQGGPKQPKP
jgi:hypothetical protein